MLFLMAIQYPYLPEGRTVEYVSADNQFMRAAHEYALAHSLDDFQKTGSVVVKNGRIIGQGANGNRYHQEHGCERVRQRIPTGERYDLCEGCNPKNHSEPKALEDAISHGEDTRGADLYLYGHWWCCKPCWDAMLAAGIKNVYLLEGSEKLFNTKR
ncbi:MAG: hypothetical protein G01um101417_140 [Parcubacteria group bacterium Gr01-1014_17]|nr:MAG: hypothetical protein G01um101417_140 [Parcubacteria group bacterium Gr01-1014_17]